MKKRKTSRGDGNPPLYSSSLKSNRPANEKKKNPRGDGNLTSISLAKVS